MKLIDLFPNYYIENKEFDCKVRLNRNETISWLKTVNGFANAEGGVLFLGVEDKTFTLIGFNQKEADNEKLFFYNEIKNHMGIVPDYVIDSVPYKVNNSIRFIIKITIIEASKKPLIVRFNGMPMIYLRRDGFTNPASEEEIRNMVLSSSHPSFDEGTTNIDFDINNYSKYASFYKERKGIDLRMKDIESVRDSIKDGKISNGLYLFSNNYNGDRSKVVCSLYRGITRGDDAIIASNSFSGNLIDCYHFIDEFVKMRMNKGFIKLDDRRIDTFAYPKRALFEAIINALAHRDYLLDGTQINVDMFANRLVISSPGSIFEGQSSLTPTYDLLSFSSKRRNEIISGLFVLANAMEAKATGFEKIVEDYSLYDKKHQPFIYSKNNTFYIVLPDLTNENGIYLDEESIYVLGVINNPTRFDLSVLSFCYMTNRSIKEITNHLNISNSTYFKTNVIQNLINQSYLIETKTGNTFYYTTNVSKIKVR